MEIEEQTYTPEPVETLPYEPVMEPAKESGTTDTPAEAPETAEPAKEPQKAKTSKKKAAGSTTTDHEKSIVITVNGQPVVLKGKSSYMLVDVLDVYSFNLADARGRRAVVNVNGVPTNFMQGLADSDHVELYWEE